MSTYDKEFEEFVRNSMASLESTLDRISKSFDHLDETLSSSLMSLENPHGNNLVSFEVVETSETSLKLLVEAIERMERNRREDYRTDTIVARTLAQNVEFARNGQYRGECRVQRGAPHQWVTGQNGRPLRVGRAG